MKPILSAATLVIVMLPSIASSANLEEQQRRCRIEQNSITRDGSDTGPECLALRAMLGMPEPPQVNVYNGGGNRFYDQRLGRWCTSHPGGAVSCD